MIYGLPKSLEISGEEYGIRSDYRDILDIMEILNDVDITDHERGYLALMFFYEDFEKIPPQNYREAVEKCFWFISGGKPEAGRKSPRLVDWEKDFPHIVSPVNHVIGYEIRAVEYLHWWTFLAAYMEIKECVFSQIVRIRNLQAKGKPLDKQDREWYRQNADLVRIPTKLSREEREYLEKMSGSRR